MNFAKFAKLTCRYCSHFAHWICLHFKFSLSYTHSNLAQIFNACCSQDYVPSCKSVILAINLFKRCVVRVVKHLRKREENNVRLRRDVIYSSVLTQGQSTRLLNSLKPAEWKREDRGRTLWFDNTLWISRRVWYTVFLRDLFCDHVYGEQMNFYNLSRWSVCPFMKI